MRAWAAMTFDQRMRWMRVAAGVGSAPETRRRARTGRGVVVIVPRVSGFSSAASIPRGEVWRSRRRLSLGSRSFPLVAGLGGRRAFAAFRLPALGPATLLLDARIDFLAMHLDFGRGVDSQFDLARANLEHGDLDRVPDPNV